MVTNVASILLCLACGFGAAVWVIVAVYDWKLGRRWAAFWYGMLAVAYIAATAVMVGRLLMLPLFIDLPRGLVVVILTPVFGVPPGIQLYGWLKARKLIAFDRGKR
jgi:hypothetical protein